MLMECRQKEPVLPKHLKSGGIVAVHIVEAMDTQIGTAIALLKSNGYRVMKPETEWKEV